MQIKTPITFSNKKKLINQISQKYKKKVYIYNLSGFLVYDSSYPFIPDPLVTIPLVHWNDFLNIIEMIETNSRYDKDNSWERLWRREYKKGNMLP